MEGKTKHSKGELWTGNITSLALFIIFHSPSGGFGASSDVTYRGVCATISLLMLGYHLLNFVVTVKLFLKNVHKKSEYLAYSGILGILDRT